MSDTRPEVECVEWYTSRLAAVTVRWPYLDAGGRDLGRSERSVYLVRVADGDAKICVAATLGRNERRRAQGQWSGLHPRAEFRERFLAQFTDPAYRAEQDALDRLEAIAWDAYREGRKAPLTRKAGPEFHDPDYDLSAEWYATRERLRLAQARWGPSGHALARAGDRLRLAQRRLLPRRDVQDLPAGEDRAGGAGQRRRGDRPAGLEPAHFRLPPPHSPCKGCVSTAMPLCHWPCSCYPTATGQVGDWMAEIYERWVSAHGVLLVTPTYWYQVSSPLKLMMDRLVCADGGNPDHQHRRQGCEEAKELELAGWDYPKHLAGRTYGVVVHGDVAGVEGTRRATCDWLDWMGLIDAGPQARLDRYVGYYEPYATSHAALDGDTGVQEEVRNVARLAASGGAAAPRRAQRRAVACARRGPSERAHCAVQPRPRGSPRR